MIRRIKLGFLFVAFWLMITTDCCDVYHHSSCVPSDHLKGNYFTNRWVVNVPGSEEDAMKVTRDLGLKYVKPIPDYAQYYFIENENVPAKHFLQHEDTMKKLKSNERVIYASQQYIHAPTIYHSDESDMIVGVRDVTT